MPTKRENLESQLKELETIVAKVEKAFKKTNGDLGEAIIDGARATKALRELRDEAAKSRLVDVRNQAQELKNRLQIAMWKGEA